MKNIDTTFEIYKQLFSYWHTFGEKLMMKIYLKNDSLEGKYISFKVMSDLRKKELVKDYTNSVVQYYYRF